MAYRMFDNPYSAQPGVHEGRTCILILDGNGKPTGKFCFSESSAARIIEKLEAAEAAGRPAGRQPLQMLGSIDGVTFSLGHHKIYGTFVTDGTTTASVPKGMREDDITPEIAEELLMAKRGRVLKRQPEAMAEVEPEAEYLYTAGDVPRFGFQFSRHLSRRADQEVYAKPLLRDIQMSDAPSRDYRYSAVDAARLLDRKDTQSAKYVLTLFLRLFERQVDDEQRAGAAKYLNQRGFNAIDSKVATPLVKYLLDHDFVTQDSKGLFIPSKKVLPVGIHLRVAELLSGYLAQVVDIMNEGVVRTGKMVRTNPRRAKKNPEDADALRKQYRRLRREALGEFAYKAGDRGPITKEDEREFDKAVKELLLNLGLPLTAKNYVFSAKKLHDKSRFTRSRK